MKAKCVSVNKHTDEFEIDSPVSVHIYQLQYQLNGRIIEKIFEVWELPALVFVVVSRVTEKVVEAISAGDSLIGALLKAKREFDDGEGSINPFDDIVEYERSRRK